MFSRTVALQTQACCAQYPTLPCIPAPPQPSSSGSSPSRACSSPVLPAPVLPTMATNSPRLIFSDKVALPAGGRSSKLPSTQRSSRASIQIAALSSSWGRCTLMNEFGYVGFASGTSKKAWIRLDATCASRKKRMNSGPALSGKVIIANKDMAVKAVGASNCCPVMAWYAANVAVDITKVAEEKDKNMTPCNSRYRNMRRSSFCLISSTRCSTVSSQA
mmetsp:Transcript_76285/g.204060  ORF Transcript_76285/g.204060 Transcript_76285/m.204060 type:complete len:218 (+) Transcript_76285:2406-3059(+)